MRLASINSPYGFSNVKIKFLASSEMADDLQPNYWRAEAALPVTHELYSCRDDIAHTEFYVKTAVETS